MFKVGDSVICTSTPLLKSTPGTIGMIKEFTMYKLYWVHFHTENIGLWLIGTQLRLQAKMTKEDLL